MLIGAGRPTVLWNATVQAGSATIGMQPNGFGFNIEGTAGIPLVVDAGLGVRRDRVRPSCTIARPTLQSLRGHRSQAQRSQRPHRTMTAAPRQPHPATAAIARPGARAASR